MNTSSPPARKRYVPAVTPGLSKLLAVVFGLFALLAVNSVYLVSVRVAGWRTGETYENQFYLYMFLAHLLLGALIIVPVIVFGVLHIKNSHDRPNRRAVRVGYGLFVCTLVLLGSGIVLTRVEGLIVITDPVARNIAWWTHAITPVGCAWLFILHRLAGKRIAWKVGRRWAGVAALFAIVMVIWQAQDPRKWNEVGNPEGVQYFFPSLARTVSGDFIDQEVLFNDQYCVKCHADVHEGWEKSAHRFSSFNNPAYLASVAGTREFSMERDGNVNASRFCAGCHDPVPFFSGAFNDPDFDMQNDPSGKAGITCTACHAITKINSPRGNSDYTIDVPIHYPFAFSDNTLLKKINEQLIKAKPEFHKKTFIKPLHKTTEFCGTCHKVHLPKELNGYKWLRGQNHQDAFWLSGVSGQGIGSFYYPPKAEESCNKCHMPLIRSEDFSARVRDESGERKTLDHMFPSANTAIPQMVVETGMLTQGQADEAIAAHAKFNEGVMRVDIFGVRQDGIDGEFQGPIEGAVPVLEPGKRYLIETVIRTKKMGHIFTQGTADSNEVWMDVIAKSGDRIIGRSGGMEDDSRWVDPYAHFVNAFVLDREGNRISRRNAEDIFTVLYSNQIPPGAADVVHYELDVPDDLTEPITIEARLRYRKFDTEYMRFVRDDPEWSNTLPILELAQDTVTFPVQAGQVGSSPKDAQPMWQRWYDYGIAFLRNGELRQAAEAFAQVEELGRPEGPLALARVYITEGRVTTDAPAALRRAAEFDPPAYEWSVLWFTGLVNKQNGEFDKAIACFKQIVEGGFAQAVGKGFDFSKDYNVQVELANTLFERAKQERGEANRAAREAFLNDAISHLETALLYDPENAAAFYNLTQIYEDLGQTDKATAARAQHEKYKVDDNAQEKAIAAARIKYPAANIASERVVLYNLRRPGAYGLPAEETAHE